MRYMRRHKIKARLAVARRVIESARAYYPLRTLYNSVAGNTTASIRTRSRINLDKFRPRGGYKLVPPLA